MTFINTPSIRSFVGFDSLFDELEKVSNFKETSYPAYNIEKTSENSYEISIALAGFSEDQIDIQIEQNILSISANNENNEKTKQYIHKGIASRAFTKQFRLAEHVEVSDASFQNGLLNIKLSKLVPEADLPQRIAINGKNKKALSSAA